MKTLSQIKSNVGVPIKKKVFVSVHLMKVSCHLRIHTLPFLSFSHRKAFKSVFFFLCFVMLWHFMSTCPIQYSPAFQVKENKEKERLERRLLDELYKIFMDSDSFYYSMTYDLTNSVQRQGDSEKTSLPLWKQVWRETQTLSWPCYLFFCMYYKNIHLTVIFILCERWMTVSSGINTWFKTLSTFR